MDTRAAMTDHPCLTCRAGCQDEETAVSLPAVGGSGIDGHMEADDTSRFCLQTREFCKLYELRTDF